MPLNTITFNDFLMYIFKTIDIPFSPILCQLLHTFGHFSQLFGYFRSMIPRYIGTAASVEALTEVTVDDREEELLAIGQSDVETPSEASGGAR